jgi:predicted dehydrogenase
VNKKICVIGAGRWGQNHIKTLHKLGHLGGIVEPDSERLKTLSEEFIVPGFVDLNQALQHGFDGYIISTPAETHYQLGKTLLEKGCSVLIEKPMALSSKHSAELVEIAEQKKICLMVGHLLLFHPAIRKIKELLENGKIGRLYYIYSNRLNLGTVRTEENVFWSFAPHDISVLDYLVGAQPLHIEAKGSKFLQDTIYDVTMTQLAYPGDIHAHIYVSWLHPFKEQRLVLVGSSGMISFDDSSVDKNILYYNKHIAWENGRPVKVEEPDEIVAYEKGQPLDEELKYFIANLGRPVDIASGKTGHEVVKVLEKVQQLISTA